VSALLIGYARCSTDEQDLTVQREGLAGLGVTPDRIYVDHGLTGCNRDRPGLREALAACREGDTLVVTKLDRLARSLPDARAIADELTARRVRLSLGGAVYDPTDPVGRLRLTPWCDAPARHVDRSSSTPRLTRTAAPPTRPTGKACASRATTPNKRPTGTPGSDQDDDTRWRPPPLPATPTDPEPRNLASSTSTGHDRLDLAFGALLRFAA